MRTALKFLILAATAAPLGACAYGGVGMGYGSPYGYNSPYGSYGSGYGSPYGYSGYGRSGVSVGIGYSSGYGSPYGYGYGSPYGGYYGSGYGSPYYGWYDNHYYPGTGYYVYDSYRRPRVWSDSQRNYWTSRQQAATAQPATRTTRATSTRPVLRENWSGFTKDRAATRAARTDRQQARSVRQTARSDRQQARTERRQTRSETRAAKRDDER